MFQAGKVDFRGFGVGAPVT